MSQNQIEITIIVNGQPIPVKVNLNSPIRVAVQHALKDSGNSGQPIQNWELRDASGLIFEIDKKVEDLGVADGAKLFLSLKAGVGG